MIGGFFVAHLCRDHDEGAKPFSSRQVVKDRDKIETEKGALAHTHRHIECSEDLGEVDSFVH